MKDEKAQSDAVIIATILRKNSNLADGTSVTSILSDYFHSKIETATFVLRAVSDGKVGIGDSDIQHLADGGLSDLKDLEKVLDELSGRKR